MTVSFLHRPPDAQQIGDCASLTQARRLSGAAAQLNSLYVPLPPSETRVVAAMSGGVDSCVTAALLQREGYDVIGVTLQLYDHGEATRRRGACCAGQDIHDARRVAAFLGIPHYVLNYEERFRASVMDDFAQSYMAGETPVPCVRCNQSVKFRDLLGMAKDLGAHVMATGHYISSRPAGNGFALYRAQDEERDQSYFLFATTREQLDFLRFPLGGLRKAETRRIAAELGLPVAQKPDSQDICFVPSGRYTQVIERLNPHAAEPGEIVHMDGRVLGRHNGVINFTIGQRRGLGVAAGEPLYVIRLDAARREVIAGPRAALRTHLVELRDVNWLGEGQAEEAAAKEQKLWVRIRSTQAPLAASLMTRGGKLWVQLHGGEDGVSPGQACVFYESAATGARVLGGGWIVTAGALCAA